MRVLAKITRSEYGANPTEGIPTVVHFEVREYDSHYRLNLIVSDGEDPHDRQELEWHSKEYIETTGYTSPAQLRAVEGSENMITVYSYNFTPLFEYMKLYDLFRLSGYYVKNKITAAALAQLEEIIRGTHESTSLFIYESEFYRTLSTLDLHWH